jgi:hypothetical protein
MPKRYLIRSVKKIKSDLKKRKQEADKLVKALEKGPKSVTLPMKHAGKPPLATAKRIQKQLADAANAMDDICGDNQLANPWDLD